MTISYIRKTRLKRRKRGGDEAREEGLAAAREMLLEAGPAAITLANVGRRIGMSHTNVIHHFGSAADLQSALMGSMIDDLMRALDEVVINIRSDAAAPVAIVEQVFAAFAEGGAGKLAAWIALRRDNEHLAPIRDAVGAMVTAIGERIPGEDSTIRGAVLLLSICAFGDAVIGPDIRAMLGEADTAMRSLTVQALVGLLLPRQIATATAG